MRSTTDITYAVAGQTLRYRSTTARPDSATFAVFRSIASDDTVAEFSGTATLDSVSTTASLASGTSQADPQKISLTSTSGIVAGRRYLISETSRMEWVDPIEVAATYVRARYPLKSDYTTAATFVSTTLVADIDAAWVNLIVNLSDHRDPEPGYRVKWTITTAGGVSIAYSFFDFVRAPIGPHVDMDDLNARAPGLDDSLPVEYRVEDGRPLIDATWRAVKAHLASAGIDADAIRNDELIDELVVLRSLRTLAEGGWKPLGFDLPTYIELTTRNYDAFFTQHVLTLNRLADSVGSGSDWRPTQPMWSK